MIGRRRLDEGPTLQSALSRAAQAGQRLVVDRLDLAMLEAKEAASRTAMGFGLGAAGATLVLAGWVAEMAALTVFLTGFVAVGVALGAIAGGHLLLAALGILAAAAVRRGSARREATGAPS